MATMVSTAGFAATARSRRLHDGGNTFASNIRQPFALLRPRWIAIRRIGAPDGDPILSRPVVPGDPGYAETGKQGLTR